MTLKIKQATRIDALSDNRSVYEQIEDITPEAVEEIKGFLRIPGISTTGEGIRESATIAESYLKRIGATVEVKETPGWPIILGRLDSRDKSAKTLIVYSLYDVTPVWEDEWVSPPFAAETIPASALDIPAEVGEVICGRGAVNQRGPMLAFIKAVEAIQRATGDIPVNLIWLWEGEEEVGSPNLGPFVEENLDYFADANAFYVPSMRQNGFGPMVLNRGYKGMVVFELAIQGGSWGGQRDGQHMWGGQTAWVDAPLMRLIKALSSMFDDEQNVAIDGFSEKVHPMSQEDTHDLAAIEASFTPELEAMFKQQMRIDRFKGGKPGKELFLHYLADPSINIEGLSGGYTGPSFFTNLPQSAAAKLELRVVPGVGKNDVARLVRAHLDRRGYQEIEIRSLRGYGSCRTSAEDPILGAAVEAAEIHGVPVSVWPTVNAACPGTLFNDPPLELPVCFAGLGHGEKYHQSNEYIELDGIQRNMEYAATFLRQWARS